MALNAARAEYARRMHRVLAHLDAHLSQPLELAGLAEVAHFSPYHFHRLFTAWMGETLGDYLRRRRLEVAALRLLTQPQTTVLELALQVGFGSGEAFARAFRQRFGCSASQWRRDKSDERALQVRELRKLDQAHRNPDQDAASEGGDDDLALQLPGAAWTASMRDWLPGSGWELDGRPTFEYYAPGASFDEVTGTFECEIVIPLAPL